MKHVSYKKKEIIMEKCTFLTKLLEMTLKVG